MWVKALKESTPQNFGSHPMVKRMLGEIDHRLFEPLIEPIPKRQLQLISIIKEIGGDFLGNISRMVYYAQKVLKCNPTAIDEIGGGVGQFYAVLKALGYEGSYYIHDLIEVREFQARYFEEVERQTGMDLRIKYSESDYCVSFYAWGEFDDENKKWYLENVIKKAPHGLIVFNPHSGASNQIDFECQITDEYPLTCEGNKMLVW